MHEVKPEDEFKHIRKISDPQLNSASDAIERSKMLERAFVLAGNTPVEVGSYFHRVDESYMFFWGHGFNSASNRHYVGMAHDYDLDLVKAYFEQLCKFPDQEPMFRAIERIRTSRFSSVSVDKAIDLGIAMEIMLLGDDEDNGELVYRMSVRGGWLLGSDPGDRALAAKTVRDIYKGRSKAVHRGAIKRTLAVTWHALEPDDFIRRIIVKILDLGHFRNWETVTFGG